jgi:tripartite-type tricarboxylate transporter receptor subunit TctC
MRRVLLLAAIFAGVPAWMSARAQDYPAHSVTFLTSVGGSSGVFMRLILDKARENTGSPALIYEQRLGGAGAPALQALKSAAPDGYTMGVTFATALDLNPFLHKDLGIDPLRDFVPVTNLVGLGLIIAARQDFPGKDIRDLVAMAKAKPGAVRVGVTGVGNRVWLAMLEERTGARFLVVPYKISTDAIASVMGGQIEAYYDAPSILSGQGGRLKALVYGGPAPSNEAPGVPLMRDLYNFDLTSWYAVVAPAGTPPKAINWMSRELIRAVNDPKVKETVEKAGFTVLGSTPDELGKLMRSEIEANAEIVRKFPDIQ